MHLKNLASRWGGTLLIMLLILLVSTGAAPQMPTGPQARPADQSHPSSVLAQISSQTSKQQPQPSQFPRSQAQPPAGSGPVGAPSARQAEQPVAADALPPQTAATDALTPQTVAADALSTQTVPVPTGKEPEPTSTTTTSPYKLSTVMPKKDSNKDILDYDDSFLAALNFSVPVAEQNRNVSQSAYTDKLLNQYHDHDQLHAYLLELAQSYPKVTRLYDIGSSVEGRKLWVFEISENPGKHDLLKPEFRYIANMHGNEVVGRELLLHLARLILENYYTNDNLVPNPDEPAGYKFIRKLVRGTRIHLMPTMNPDGFARSEVGCKYEVPSRKGRLNANNVDLNRNFPNKVVHSQVDAGTQVETRAVIDWSYQVPFVLSANMHGGALVAVIPYDASLNTSTIDQPDERKCPDEAIFMDISRAYTKSHWTMWKGEMCYDECTKYHPEVFPNDGIISGSAWYQTYHSLMDWTYDFTNDFQITLELGCNQYPPPESLRQYWDMNKVAMLSFMRQAHRGIKGMVEDAVTGRPLANVNVHVRSNDHNITSTQYGDYFRLMAPGLYKVLFELPGYHTEELSIMLRDSMAQIHNIRLRPLDASQAPVVTGPPPTRPADGPDMPVVTIDDDRSKVPADGVHPVAVATLVMSVITVALLILLAGAFVIQKRRFARSQSVSVELQPTVRSTSSTGINLPPLKSTSASGSHMQG